ncbi:MAG: hypothetical protein OCD76_04390 [Reichenbachiella sp.]
MEANKKHNVKLYSPTQNIPKVNQLFFILRWGDKFNDVVIKTQKGIRALKSNDDTKEWINIDYF